MPVYDYKCQEHGFFSALATMDEFADPKPCPQCTELAAKVIILPPELFKLDDAERKAQDRNEKSRHEPVFSTPEYRQEQQARLDHGHAKGHGKGCGCGSEPIGKSKMFYTADGKKMFPSMRPWMISH